jgi:putative DNA primase/helicase
VRGEGGYVLVPPSIHPSGHIYDWLRNEDDVPVAFAPNWLLEKLRDLADSCGQSESAPAVSAADRALIPEGCRNGELASLAGTMRKRGMSHEAITAALQAENINRCDPPLGKDEVEAIARSVGRYAPAPAHSTPSTAEWPHPQPLDAELLPVEPFSLESLPISFRPLIEDVSERMQTPPDFAAAAAVVALAGVVNRRAAVKPKREDDWTVIPNLWGALIGKPGYMKSPVLRSMTWPLLSIEQRWRMEHKAELTEFEKDEERMNLGHEAWKQSYKKAVSKGEEPPIEPDDSLEPPPERRLLITDSTFEKLHEILVDNPAGVLIVRDELAGWLAQMDKPGRESERQFYLQAWNGDSHFNVDRIGRGTLHVPAVCVSLLGNIQPSRLRTYLQDSITGGPTDDGLIQRFQISVWPETDPAWQLVDRRPNQAAIASVRGVFSKLVELSAEDPVRVCFGPKAQELFFAWWRELEEKVRGEYGLHPALVAHLAKYRSLFPTLAALFELADRAAAAGLDADVLINQDHAEQAAAFCQYLESHARRMYGCIASPEMAAARELARHLELGDLRGTFSTRDVYRKGWSGLTQPDEARSALELLDDSDWVRQRDVLPAVAGGRPTEQWESNPRIRRHGE